VYMGPENSGTGLGTTLAALVVQICSCLAKDRFSCVNAYDDGECVKVSGRSGRKFCVSSDEDSGVARPHR